MRQCSLSDPFHFEILFFSSFVYTMSDGATLRSPGPEEEEGHHKQKQQKVGEHSGGTTTKEVQNSIIIQFVSQDGESTGPQLDVPSTVTPSQCQTLLQGLLTDEEERPYSFYINDQELGGSLEEHVQKNKISVETLLKVVYRPQAIFRVRPVTRCSASIPGHEAAILCVHFSPDGKGLCTGSGDTTVRFWHLGSQTPRHVCRGHKSWVLSVVWSPDAAMVASGDKDGAIWLWDPQTGKALGQCRGHRKFISSICWEPAHEALPSRKFCSGSKDGTVKVWEAATRRHVCSMGSHSAGVTAVLWGGDGLIYSAARDCTINVWRAKDGSMVRTLRGHGHWVNTMSLSTSYALKTGAFDHKGQRPASDDQAKKAALDRYIEAKGGQTAPERLVTGSDDFTLCLWEPGRDKNAIARMTGHQQLVNQVCFSPDGRWILSASFDKSVKLWDGIKGTFVATFRGHVGPVYQVAWSADSRLAVSGSKDSTLKLWDIRTRKAVVDLPGHADEVFTVDWSPTGDAVASGGRDKVLKLWKQ
jgi:ribosome assembly protein 4